jgi:hypothetical protein
MAALVGTVRCGTYGYGTGMGMGMPTKASRGKLGERVFLLP